MSETGKVIAVAAQGHYALSKPTVDRITLVKGLGVEGDIHNGVTVKHRSRVAKDPTQPNLRQVHLIHAELHDELREKGFKVEPGIMGENITTQGIDVLALPRGTRLHLGQSAIVEVTGLRNPCHQLEGYQKGLMHASLDRDADGELVLKAGIMSIVIEGGDIAAGDTIRVELPPEPHEKLQRV